MAQLDFELPDFLQDNSAEEIHERMMNNLPADIDNLPGGFPYDLTKPAALEKDELINFHLARALMLAFPQYAWDDWLDLHGQQVHVTRHDAQKASGEITVTGEEGTQILAGSVFCTPETDSENPSLNFLSKEDVTIPVEGEVTIGIIAEEGGTEYNVPRGTITIMADPVKGIASITNENELTGGTEIESDDDYYDRIAAEYENSRMYLGNDSDYIRWAKAAGAGDCIVLAAWNGPGTVKLALVDQNNQPATEELVQAVYDYIVSEADRSKRLLPTGCAELTCVPATTRTVDYTITGLQYDSTTGIEQIKEDFVSAVNSVCSKAKEASLLRYNDVRTIIMGIAGVEDFETFLIDGSMENVALNLYEYPRTGTLDFS